MKNSFLRFSLILLLFVPSMLAAQQAEANQWNAVPELEPRQQLAVRRGYDGPRYNSSRACFRGFQSLAGARYFGVLVDVTDPSGSRSRDHGDASAYARHVAEEWSEAGRLDLETDVVVTIGVANRSVGVFVGERWQKMGLTQETLQETIAASHFPRQLRRLAYGDALCDALPAIDYRLVFFAGEHQQRVELAKEMFPDARERFDALQARVRAALPDENEHRAALLATLQEATPLLEHGDNLELLPEPAIEAARSLELLSASVEADLQGYLLTLATLDELEESIAALIAGIDTRNDRDWDGPVAAKEIAHQCRESAARARLAATPDLLSVQKCIADAEVELARSDERHYFLARALPRSLFFLFVVLLSLGLLAQFLRRRRALLLLDADLLTWQTALAESTTKLQRLQRDFPWYFRPRQSFWQGERAGADQTISDGINSAHLLHSEGLALLEKARSLRAGSKILDTRKLEKALRLLRKTPLHFNAGQCPDENPLSRGLASPVQSSATQIFSDFDRAFFTAQEGLRSVAPLQSRIAELLSQGRSALQSVQEEIEERSRRNLPVTHLTESFAQTNQRWAEAADLVDQFPEEGAQALEEISSDLAALLSRARGGNQILTTLEGPIHDLRHRLDSLLEHARRQGLQFGDGHFDPTSVGEDAATRCAELIDLVASGRESDAEHILAPLAADLELTVLRLTVCLEAKSAVPQLLRHLQALEPQFKEPLFHTRMQLQRLTTAENEPELSAYVDEIGWLQKMAPRLGRLLSKIQGTHEAGKNLASVADLTTLTEALSQGLDNLAAIQTFVARQEDPAAEPAAPIWQPPAAWSESSIRNWGVSDDAEIFRSISLPERDEQAEQRRHPALMR